MKIKGMIVGPILGVALVLFGAWLGGFEWHRGFEAVMLYFFTLFAVATGFVLGGTADS
ncbi:hypothetical protein ACN9MB_08995 [Dyella kyungheensis]|uniref:hypothetical protein n=1 Tax=Dyella kyungheensis TaxID=1242174 RepID=UPI003CEA7292